jgi:hypothetical protein
MTNSATHTARPVRSPPRRTRRRLGRRQRFLRQLRSVPRSVRIALISVVAVAVIFAADVTYQLARKPTEMLFFAAGATKLPAETWRHYGSLFREYSTEQVSPELLAALAQIEAAGDPVARTYWHWRLTWNPLRLYEPASSSVGMYQMTDAAFSEARRYCIRDHAVTENCWFNGSYMRVLPSHAVELAAIFLDRELSLLLPSERKEAATPEQEQDLAAMIYLCGPAPAEAYVRRGFRLLSGQRCGDHDAAGYLARVDDARRQFARLAAAAAANEK